MAGGVIGGVKWRNEAKINGESEGGTMALLYGLALKSVSAEKAISRKRQWRNQPSKIESCAGASENEMHL
jgi:hypothetical protein